MKLVRGTFRGDRANDNAPGQAPDGMRAPAWLPVGAIEHFGVLKARIEEYGLNSSSFTETLAMAALRLDEIDQLTAIIDAEGPVYESEKFGKSGGGDPAKTVLKKSHPAVKQRAEALRHLQSLLAEFGLTPATISKVNTGGKNEKNNNPFAKFAQ